MLAGAVERAGRDTAGSTAMADSLLDLLGPGPGLPVLLHGQGNTCWPTLRHAARLGLPPVSA